MSVHISFFDNMLFIFFLSIEVKESSKNCEKSRQLYGLMSTGEAGFRILGSSSLILNLLEKTKCFMKQPIIAT